MKTPSYKLHRILPCSVPPLGREEGTAVNREIQGGVSGMEQVEMSSRTQAGKSGEEGCPSRAASGRREHRSR